MVSLKIQRAYWDELRTCNKKYDQEIVILKRYLKEIKSEFEEVKCWKSYFKEAMLEVVNG